MSNLFIDTAKIVVKGGDGGDGIIAFRREKYVPMGGPAGGDGGNGADVIFRVDEGLKTLLDFKYQRLIEGERGERGKPKNMHGANAQPRIISVPPGTLVIDDETKDVIADLVSDGQEAVVAQGGRGGKGNVRFKTARNPAPYLAENGEKGQERQIVLELKLLADVGLVGFPNVGKSTLISVVSAAKPKIAAYHFTTLTPNLGVVDAGDGRNFVMADLPGLIEGAHAGVGLGHQFLKHVERTKVIIHVIDMSGSEGRDPFEDWLSINEELALYNEALANLPQIIAANKMDMPDAEEQLKSFRERLAEHEAKLNEAKLNEAMDEEARDESNVRYDVFPISAMSQQGTRELIYKAADMLDELAQMPPLEIEEVSDTEARIIFRLNEEAPPSFKVYRQDDIFIVEGEQIDDLLHRTQFGSHDAVARFLRLLRKMGVDEELRRLGAEHGQTVRIGELEFEYFD